MKYCINRKHHYHYFHTGMVGIDELFAVGGRILVTLNTEGTVISYQLITLCTGCCEDGIDPIDSLNFLLMTCARVPCKTRRSSENILTYFNLGKQLDIKCTVNSYKKYTRNVLCLAFHLFVRHFMLDLLYQEPHIHLSYH